MRERGLPRVTYKDAGPEFPSVKIDTKLVSRLLKENGMTDQQIQKVKILVLPKLKWDWGEVFRPGASYSAEDREMHISTHLSGNPSKKELELELKERILHESGHVIRDFVGGEKSKDVDNAAYGLRFLSPFVVFFVAALIEKSSQGATSSSVFINSAITTILYEAGLRFKSIEYYFRPEEKFAYSFEEKHVSNQKWAKIIKVSK